MTFDLDRFISDCAELIAEPAPTKPIRDIVARAVSEPNALQQALGIPKRGQVERLHVSEELTVLNVIWAPGMTIMPHNHHMWAVIGVYGGREDNIFWRRCDNDANGLIEAAGAKSLGPGDVRALGEEIIHSVTNPTSQFTGAIHVYGGDFFTTERSEWDPQTLHEHPYDVDKNMAMFERANASLGQGPV